MDWLDGLVVHEFRHVNQFDKARQGIGRVAGAAAGRGRPGRGGGGRAAMVF
ncbi:MAG: hypothetical protein WKG07_25790 [Hymenobacter sp.]